MCDEKCDEYWLWLTKTTFMENESPLYYILFNWTTDFNFP